MRHPYTPLARTLRANPTREERHLWHFLRQRPLGFKFRRQVPIGEYIADFACLSARLIIEVDGRFHADQEHDVTRDALLTARGWEVLRFWNEDVWRDTEAVFSAIINRLLERIPVPHPSPADSPAPPGRGE